MASVDDGCVVVENADVSIDRKLSENEKLSLFKKLEDYPSLWDSRNISFKDRDQRKNALETISSEFHLTPNGVKKILHCARSAHVREVKKQLDGGETSKWKYFEVLSFMTDDVEQSLKIKEEKEWNDEETESLVQFYKVNESMWNHKIASYKDRSLREVNFAKLKEILPSRSQDDIKKQWHVLKTIFGREVKREEGSKVSGAGADTVYTSKWRFLADMMFVKGSDDVDTPVTTLEDHVQVKTPAKKFKATERYAEEVKLELYKEAIKCLREPLSSSEHIAQENVNPQNDEIGLFVKSLESTLRRFTPRQCAFAKKRMHDVIFELEIDQSCFTTSASQSLRCTTTCSSQPSPSDQLTSFAGCTTSLGWPSLQ